MKKTLIFMLITCSIVACNNDSPSGVVSDFLDCLMAKDYKCAKQYCTSTGVVALEFYESIGKTEYEFSGYKIIRDSIVSDRAWVFYEGLANGHKRRSSIELARVEGKWKVDPSLRK